MLILSQRLRDKTLFLIMKGCLTKKDVYKINDYIIPFIKKEQVQELVCDCSGLKHIDYDGKYVLLKTKLVLRKQKGHMLLCDVKASVKNELLGYRMRIQ